MTQIKGKNLFEITIFNSPIENTNYKQLLAYKIMYRDIINNVFLRFEWNESLNIYPCFSLTCPTLLKGHNCHESHSKRITGFLAFFYDAKYSMFVARYLI